MVALFIQLGVPIVHGALGQVGFYADDGFNACGFGGAVEGHCAVHGAMVGEGDGGLVEFGGTFDKVINAAEAVE
ncbi:MAG: hypothetical protein Kow0080_15840 [Candidatus Promineifilaceae bacterium]